MPPGNVFAFKDFNPRSPRGERPCVKRGTKIQRISIHAPREGSDEGAAIAEALEDLISIHAPREGSDARLGIR